MRTKAFVAYSIKINKKPERNSEEAIRNLKKHTEYKQAKNQALWMLKSNGSKSHCFKMVTE